MYSFMILLSSHDSDTLKCISYSDHYLTKLLFILHLTLLQFFPHGVCGHKPQKASVSYPTRILCLTQHEPPVLQSAF